MMLSVYRQGRARSQLDHLACIDLAASSADIDLITFCYLNSKPALIGFDGVQAVVKPEEAGDEAYSFESLFDTAVSQYELERLQCHGVQSLDDLKPKLFEAWLTVDIPFHPRVRIRVTAKDERAAAIKLRGLLKQGEPFLQRLVEEVSNQIFASEDIEVVTAGYLCVDDPAPDNTPEWDFLPPPTGGDDADPKTE